VKIHGLPDKFIEHGSLDELHRIVKLDAAGIIEIAKEHLKAVRGNPALRVV
jgi:deoxyxylulose-5-phosphate synthase